MKGGYIVYHRIQGYIEGYIRKLLNQHNILLRWVKKNFDNPKMFQKKKKTNNKNYIALYMLLIFCLFIYAYLFICFYFW